jgi:TRAP-type C4-dicarboxylate transport system permease small subunit
VKIAAAQVLTACQSTIGRSADKLMHWQRNLVGALVAFTVLLILLNVVTRALNVALFWVDELAIYSMIWAFMLGAAATVRGRQGIAISLAHDYASPRARAWLALTSDSVVLLFSLSLMAFNWLWFDPLLLVSVDFEIPAFIKASFNFIYKEQTSTLGIAKWWVWLIMPLMAVLMSLHALANWLDSLVSQREQRLVRN